MAIRASSAKQVDSLLADLAAADDVRREAAVARLIVIGDRAVDRLIAVADRSDDPRTQTAALRALEGIGSERALGIALRRIDDSDPATARAAIGLARVFLKSAKGSQVLDRLTAVALDTHRTEAVRAAAVSALRELDARTIRPILKKLAADTSSAVRAAAERSGPPAATADDGRNHDGPEEIRDWLKREGDKAPLASVLGIIEGVRERGASAPPSRRPDWTAVRFAAHLVLARRRSRIALYDLRESLAAASAPLPADALAAVGLIGDVSCLEPLASAYGRSKHSQWRGQLLETFHAIAKREKITARHAVMKKIGKRLSTP